MRLFHFSDDPNITEFEPRPVRTPVARPGGQAWLNGPLVWAIDAAHGFLYLFPRECPRILVWPTPESSPDDLARWLGPTSARAVAFIETAWVERLRRAAIFRYELPAASFENLCAIGMWVSRTRVAPAGVHRLTDLHERLEEQEIELRPMETLTPLKGIWDSTLHASGIRLRNVAGWGAPGWPHSTPGRAAPVSRKS